MKKKILISPVIYQNLNKEKFFSFSSNWIKYLKKLNFIPYFFNNFKEKLDVYDGLLIPGTGEIFKISKLKLDKDRENIEKRLIKHFLNKNKPILTVCRGTLLISSINGSKIVKIKGHVKKIHDIKLNKNFIKTNSYHNYMILNKPKGFKVIGKTKDNCIEILQNNKKNILSLMFHPERKNFSQKYIDKMIKNFFS